MQPGGMDDLGLVILAAAAGLSGVYHFAAPSNSLVETAVVMGSAFTALTLMPSYDEKRKFVAPGVAAGAAYYMSGGDVRHAAVAAGVIAVPMLAMGM